MKIIENINYHRKAVLTALAICLCAGLGAFSVVSATEKQEANDTSQGVNVHLQKGNSPLTQKRINLNATINKMRQSEPNLSLPANLFEPWWQTMFRDPDSEWLLNNFDIMSSDPDKKWAFPLGSGSYIPRVDIDASNTMVRLSAEVPGIDEKDLDVTVTDDTISIKGEKHADQAQKSANGLQSIERHYGAFERTVTLPCRVNSNKAEAKLKNGILTVSIPKAEDKVAEGKKLTISRE